MWTAHDPVLSRVRHMVENGWSHDIIGELSPYKHQEMELSVVRGCLLWGSRVVIPTAGRKQALELLHEGHLSMSRIKAKACGLMWWLKIDTDIEEMVKTCSQCQLTHHIPCQSWDFPSETWKRIHIDYARPFMGKMFSILVDSYSNG